MGSPARARSRRSNVRTAGLISGIIDLHPGHRAVDLRRCRWAFASKGHSHQLLSWACLGRRTSWWGRGRLSLSRRRVFHCKAVLFIRCPKRPRRSGLHRRRSRCRRTTDHHLTRTGWRPLHLGFVAEAGGDVRVVVGVGHVGPEQELVELGKGRDTRG